MGDTIRCLEKRQTVPFLAVERISSRGRALAKRSSLTIWAADVTVAVTTPESRDTFATDASAANRSRAGGQACRRLENKAFYFNWGAGENSRGIRF
jgi:hypothetical protein